MLHIFTACAPVYVANNVNTPQFSEGGEIIVGGNYGTNGAEIQLAAAVTDHIALMGNGSFASRSEDDEIHKHNFLEAGLGWFTSFRESGRFDLFAGYGGGNAEYKGNGAHIFSSGNLVKISGDYDRIFFQTSIGAVYKGKRERKPDITFGLAIRYTIVRFENFFNSEDIHLTAENTFIEPVFFASIGKKMLHLKTQIGFVRPLKYVENRPFDYDRMWTSVGLYLRFGGKNSTDKY